jgi:hypothetical protein
MVDLSVCLCVCLQEERCSFRSLVLVAHTVYHAVYRVLRLRLLLSSLSYYTRGMVRMREETGIACGSCCHLRLHIHCLLFASSLRFRQTF